MKRYAPVAIAVLLALTLVAIGVTQLHHLTLFNPKGLIAEKESGLIILSILLMLVVIVPVYILTFFFAWRYRASNTKALYTPDWQHSKMDELVWWAIPFEIILILGALTWSSTHELDPRKPLDSTVAPIVVEVVALPSKWLFIYPEQGVASVNTLQFPVDTPIAFKITSDAPMNSFWIPQLGGQMYAMTGMITELNLEASEVGTYRGLSANYSGKGFADMKFDAVASSQDSFNAWVEKASASGKKLDANTYNALALPTTSPVLYFKLADTTLFNSIVMKFNQLTQTHPH